MRSDECSEMETYRGANEHGGEASAKHTLSTCIALPDLHRSSGRFYEVLDIKELEAQSI